MLQRETAKLHLAVDQKISGFLDNNANGYRKMLALHGQIIPGAEDFLKKHKHLKDMPDLDSRWRSEAIRSDLETLDETPLPAIDMSFLNAQPFSVGVMYVLEGSRLGGRMIANQLGNVATAELPKRFLMHGSEQRLWNSFVAWLNVLQWSAQEERLAVQGAKEVFSAYLKA